MDDYLSRERLLNVRQHKYFGTFKKIIMVLILLDLVVLNLKTFHAPAPSAPDAQPQSANTQTQESDSKTVDVCGADCMSQINKAVSSLASPQKAAPPLAPAQSSAVKEYFIPFGTGSVASTDWKTVSGMQATINGSSYGRIKSATFEITVRVPTGNETADFELYNSSASHPVWLSNVTFMGGTTSQLLVSSPISLDSGSNTYVIQARTQLSDPAVIEQARVHVITQ
ncbi:MAG TPA: hypothetical protein VG965_00905 [Patescibacteria group bacterium]|nr:hypothetical protein [Patescibacteria group bacterium]